MIEKLVTSKTRIKLLKLFLSHIDDRYYLRELERLLEESLSPLRRQLLKLTSMGILITEEEANLKYYRLNKNFEGLEDLRRILLEDSGLARTSGSQLRESPEAAISKVDSIPEIAASRSNDIIEALSASPKQFRYDLALLSFISIFVLVTAMFVVYANSKNIKQVAKLISNKEAVIEPAPAIYSPDRPNNTNNNNNGEMMSKKWKLMPGNVPVFSSGETGEEKNSKEL